MKEHIAAKRQWERELDEDSSSEEEEDDDAMDSEEAAEEGKQDIGTIWRGKDGKHIQKTQLQ